MAQSLDLESHIGNINIHVIVFSKLVLSSGINDSSSNYFPENSVCNLCTVIIFFEYYNVNTIHTLIVPLRSDNAL